MQVLLYFQRLKLILQHQLVGLYHTWWEDLFLQVLEDHLLSADLYAHKISAFNDNPSAESYMVWMIFIDFSFPKTQLKLLNGKPIDIHDRNCST